MILFKASGKTYHRVATQERHAFPFSPREVRQHEFVLLSKNREDCASTECQIQYVAKLLSVNEVTPEVLDQYFPGVHAGERWTYLATLYWSRPLRRHFNLSHVPGLNYRRYDVAQEFVRLDDSDELLLFNFLCESNPEMIVEFISKAEPPDLSD